MHEFSDCLRSLTKPVSLTRWLMVSCVSIMLSGCLDFGTDIETTTPTAQQVAECRQVMFINPQVAITPLGYKLLGSGIDDARWLKFTIDASDVPRLFVAPVDNTKLTSPTILGSDGPPLWWTPSKSGLVGGPVELPNAKFMRVGTEPADRSNQAVVYIMWHET